MFVSQAHSFAQQARLAITLAWVAGYTNIIALLTCGWAISHVSGTVSQWGRDLAEANWRVAGFTSFLLVTFILGAMLAAFCTETGRRRGWQSIYVLPVALQAGLLAAFAVGVELHDERQIESGAMLYAMTGLASMAMGLQNATITRISGGVVRTTHMTGVFTDLGLEGVQFLYWLQDRKVDSPPLPSRALIHSVRVHPTARRLALLGSIVGSFALGAGLGAAAFDQLPRWAMFPPVLFLLWIIFQDVRTPICEIEPSDLVGGEHGLRLPEAIAVYHLRKGAGGRGKVHRLPDLLRWCERLPASKRVVILDLSEVTLLDANAALELRALMKQFDAQRRRLVISGINGEQYHAMRAAGAGDALDPTNVCPDLELAIARGWLLVEEAERRHDLLGGRGADVALDEW
ncbi:MAG: DUF1275 family protein [Phycisphaerales bacterium]|nr:DUF1275 family protein [Phycisphaerales bacterium]